MEMGDNIYDPLLNGNINVHLIYDCNSLKRRMYIDKDWKMNKIESSYTQVVGLQMPLL